MSRMEEMEKRKDLEIQLAAARKEQAAKLADSKEFLLGQLRMASEKYLTVNGYMQARQTLEQVTFGNNDGLYDNEDARTLAREMSELAGTLAGQLEAVDVMDLSESFLDGLLIADFVTSDPTVMDTARQLLVVNLLQNVGPPVDEIVQYRAGTAAGLLTLEEALAALPAPAAKSTKKSGKSGLKSV